MVDLRTQTSRIQQEIDDSIKEVVSSCAFIKGPQVQTFENKLADYLGVEYVISCANGTDALQIAMMALGLAPGDEIIVPAFTYVATAEVIALLGLTPVMVDVDPQTFNIDLEALADAIGPKTKAIVPVHLFGMSSDMEVIMNLASKHNLYVIEDNAQAIGASYSFDSRLSKKAGTLGHIGCTSFFPSKNLGCFGDGGAIMTRDKELADKIRSIANHGQKIKYHHERVGVNSRLDSLQAAVLNVKIDHLDHYIAARQNAAAFYDQCLSALPDIKIPFRAAYSDHVFHQYTLQVSGDKRDGLKEYLQTRGIPSMIYYPIPLYKQNAYRSYWQGNDELPITEVLCKRVLSLPMHTELTEEQQVYICDAILSYFLNK